jgi:hypothetical protein
MKTVKTRKFLLDNLKTALKNAVSAGKTAHLLAIAKEIERLDSIPEQEILERLKTEMQDLAEKVKFHGSILNTRTVPGNGRLGVPG